MFRLAAVALLAGCFQAQAIECADGTICPSGAKCDLAAHTCISPDQAGACAGLHDGDSCTLAGAPGTCVDGGCQLAFCGDGTRNGAEPCEGTDLGGLTCNDFGFTISDGLACTAQCTFDRSACHGRCGDGVIDPGEACDGAAPMGACVDFGYDAGNLTCGPGCGASFASCARFGWIPEATPVATPFGIGGLSVNDLWLVGDQGAVGHYDGTQWTVVPSGTTQVLSSVWAIAHDDVWIGGNNGTLLHWDGATLAAVAAPNDNFQAVWAADGTHVFLAGNYDVYVRNGASWDLVGDLHTAIVPSTTLALRGTNPSDLWVASTGANCDAWHWDGIAWSDQQLDADPSCLLSDLAVDAADSLWAVATHDDGVSPMAGVLVHRTAGGVSELALQIDSPQGIGFVSASEVWTGGTAQLSYFDGNLALATAISDLQASRILKMFATGPNDMAALAQDGTLYRYRGQAYARPVNPAPAIAFWTSPTGVPFLLDTTGEATWQLRSDFLWEPQTASTAPLRAFSGTAANDVWASGDDGLYHFDGLAWSQQLAGLFTAVWSRTASDVWAARANGQMRHYDGATWSSRDLPITSIHARSITGSSANDVWAVAEDSLHINQYGLLGELWHWDGAAWTQITVANPNLRAAYAPAAGQVMMVAADGHALHWDGTQWHDSTLGGVLAQIDGTALDDIYAASTVALFHYDGTTWSPMALPPDLRAPGSGTIVGIRARADHLDLVTTELNAYHTLLHTKPF